MWKISNRQSHIALFWSLVGETFPYNIWPYSHVCTYFFMCYSRRRCVFRGTPVHKEEPQAERYIFMAVEGFGGSGREECWGRGEAGSLLQAGSASSVSHPCGGVSNSQQGGAESLRRGATRKSPRASGFGSPSNSETVAWICFVFGPNTGASSWVSQQKSKFLSWVHSWVNYLI